MRNENKFSTQKVREIFLIRAPPFFYSKNRNKIHFAQRQNSFANAADTLIIVKLRSYYLSRRKIFSTIYLRFIPKILLVIPILQECFFRGRRKRVFCSRTYKQHYFIRNPGILRLERKDIRVKRVRILHTGWNTRYS